MKNKVGLRLSENQNRKLGIASLHYGFNEGAILQCRALSDTLQNLFQDQPVEVLDHRYPEKMRAYGEADDPRKKALADAIQKWLPLSEEKFYSSDRERTLEYAASKYRCLVIGSDVVWNVRYRRRFKGLLKVQNNSFYPAFPNVYWPGEELGIPRIAYAASVGLTDWKSIPPSHKRKMRKILSDFTALGYRDEWTRRFLEHLSSSLAEKATWTPDPTFLTDVTDEVDVGALQRRLQSLGVDFSKRIVGVLAHDTEDLSAGLSSLKGRDVQMVAINLPNSACDIDLSGQGFHPAEWARLHGFFDFIVTSRMHSAIFCIKQNTPFVILEIDQSRGVEVTKNQDLLNQFGLPDLILSLENQGREKLTELFRRCNDYEWNWDAIAERRRQASDKGLAFLRRAPCFIGEA
jgi:hypothetical protein